MDSGLESAAPQGSWFCRLLDRWTFGDTEVFRALFLTLIGEKYRRGLSAQRNGVKTKEIREVLDSSAA